MIVTLPTTLRDLAESVHQGDNSAIPAFHDLLLEACGENNHWVFRALNSPEPMTRVMAVGWTSAWKCYDRDRFLFVDGPGDALVETPDHNFTIYRTHDWDHHK